MLGTFSEPTATTRARCAVLCFPPVRFGDGETCSHRPAPSLAQVYPVPMEVIVKNKLRAAEVWMDEFKDIVKRVMPPLPPQMSLGASRAVCMA